MQGVFLLSVTFHVRVLYFLELCGIINYLICVRTNKSYEWGSGYMIKNNIEVDVKVKCIEHGLTQAQLAEIIDISTIHMSHLETGSVAMSLECMIKVCNALEVSPDDLLIGEFELNNNATIKQLAEITKNLSSDENKLLIDFALLLEKNKPNRN